MLSWTLCWIFSCGILLYPIPLEFILRGVHVTTSDTTPFRIPKRTRRCGWNSPDLCPGGIQRQMTVRFNIPNRRGNCRMAWVFGCKYSNKLVKYIGEKLIPPLIGESWWWVYIHSFFFGLMTIPQREETLGVEFRPHSTYGTEVSASWETESKKMESLQTILCLKLQNGYKAQQIFSLVFYHLLEKELCNWDLLG